jgi:spectinomycin phosphotransferase
MMSEPDIHLNALHTWLAETYPLALKTLTFMPQGECGWQYRAIDDDEVVYVLKLSQAGLCGTGQINDQTIRAWQALYYEFGITQMPPPPLRGTTGAYINPLHDWTAILIKFIEGTPAYEKPLDEPQQRQLGTLMARLHRCKLHPRERPQTEDFAPHIPMLLRQILDEAYSPTRQYAPFHLKLLGILQKLAAPIERQLVAFTHLQKSLQEDAGLQADFVLCHGDPSPGNILVTPDANVVLIDWDAPVFAPRERDLFFLMQQPAVMAAYQNGIGEVSLRPEVLKFYQLAWDLGEIVDYGTRILFRRQSQTQNKHDVLSLVDHLKHLSF